MMSVDTLLASTARHVACGSNEPGCITTRAPQYSHDNEVHCAAACIIGASGKATKSKSMIRSSTSSGRSTGPLSRMGSPPPMHEKNASPWRHTTPLGIPVVPPV